MESFDSKRDRKLAKKFARQVSAALTAAGDTRMAQFDRDKFQLVLTDYGRDAGIIRLWHLYREHYELPPSQREAHLKRVVRVSLGQQIELPDEFEHARPNIFPIVRNRSFAFDDLGTLRWPYQPIGDDLAVGLTFDLPDSMLFIGPDHIAKWKITFNDAMEAARQNLAGRGNFEFASLDGRVYTSMTGDSYDATRLLLIDSIRNLRVDGDHVAIAPNKNALIITGSEDVAGLRTMAQLAERALKAPRPMMGTAIRLSGGHWLPWMPSCEHPVYRQYKSLSVDSLNIEYGLQQEQLIARYKENDIREYVVPFLTATTPAGNPFSFSVWNSTGLTHLLPKVDQVAFAQMEIEEPVAWADWERIVQVVGDLLEEVDIYPVRYRATTFPNEDQLKAIGMEHPK